MPFTSNYPQLLHIKAKGRNYHLTRYLARPRKQAQVHVSVLLPGIKQTKVVICQLSILAICGPPFLQLAELCF